MVAEFSTLPAQELIAVPEMPPLDPVAEPNFVYHAEADAPSAVVDLIALTNLPEGIEQAAQAQADVLPQLMTIILNRRFQMAIDAQPEGPILGASAFVYDYFSYRHAGLRAQAKPGRELEALQQLNVWWRQSQEFIPGTAEITAAVASYQATLEKAVEQQANRPNKALADQLYSSVRDGLVMQAPADRLALLSPALAAATPESVRDIWRQQIEPVRMVAVSGRVELSDEDPQAAVAAAWKAANAEAISAPAVAEDVTWAYGDVPAGEAVVATEVPTDFAQTVHRLQLSNGIIVTVLPRAAKPNEVLLSAHVDIPLAQQRPSAVTSLANAATAASGLDAHDQAALQQIFAGSTVAFQGPAISPTQILYSGQSSDAGIDEWFMRLRASLDHQTIREPVFQRQRTRLLENIHNSRDNIEAEIGRRAQALMTPADPVILSPNPAHIERLTRGGVRHWLKPLLQGAPLSVTVVGDCSLATVEKAAAKWLSSLPTRSLVVVTDDLTAPEALLPSPPLVAGDLSFSIPGHEARTILRLGLPTDDFADVQKTRRLAILAGVIRDKLREELREALGQAYSPYAVHRPGDRYEGHGTLLVQASVAPEQAAAARAAIERIVAEVHAGEITEDTFTRIMEPQLKSLVAYRDGNGYWLSTVLAKSVAQPQRLAWAASMVDDFNAITVDEIRALGIEYADLDDAMWVIGTVTEKDTANNDQQQCGAVAGIRRLNAANGDLERATFRKATPLRDVDRKFWCAFCTTKVSDCIIKVEGFLRSFASFAQGVAAGDQQSARFENRADFL